jgi:sulfur carrier protein
MKILVNGVSHDTGASELASALRELGYGGDAVIATALNGEFIPSNSRPRARLAEGDRVEVVAPMQGG